MNNVVLDASALLALLLGELGADAEPLRRHEAPAFMAATTRSRRFYDSAATMVSLRDPDTTESQHPSPRYPHRLRQNGSSSNRSRVAQIMQPLAAGQGGLSHSIAIGLNKRLTTQISWLKLSS